MSARWRLHASSMPAEGEIENGDLAILREDPATSMLAVIDALGHGPKAAEVAAIAGAYLTSLSLDERLTADGVVSGLHSALTGSRGAAAMVLLLRGSSVEACGVGNVDLRCVGASLPVTLTPGILGTRVARLRIIQGQVAPSARLFVFSDGISSRTPFLDLARLPPEEASAQALRAHRNRRDDATFAAAILQESRLLQRRRGQSHPHHQALAPAAGAGPGPHHRRAARPALRGPAPPHP